MAALYNKREGGLGEVSAHIDGMTIFAGGIWFVLQR